MRLAVVALLVALALAAVAPLHSYDSFWHLATGRWIVEHRALPATDPFAVASDQIPWINGEWLFQIGLYGAEQLVGLSGLSWLRALVLAGLFVFCWREAARSSDSHTALLAACIAFAGATATFDVRPSALAGVLVALAVVVARRGPVWLFALLTVTWMNIHPSALIAPLIAYLAVEMESDAALTAQTFARRRLFMAGASAVSLLINPYGWRGIAAPLELLALVGGDEFVNVEWLPSAPLTFPLLYLAVAAALAAFATSRDLRRQLGNALLLAVFAWLAVRHVRHQGLFYAAFPLLVMPAIGAGRIPRIAAMAGALVAVMSVALTGDHGTGPSPSRFPVTSVARLRASGLDGNIYNPDQFGGFLIWSFYPDRRTLTDGRNELHRTYIRRFAKARLDERAWRDLLRTYRVDLAVDEYRPALEVRDAVSGRTSRLPASVAYWPRRDWALIGFDEVSMVFARRRAFAPETLSKLELRDVVPDAR